MGNNKNKKTGSQPGWVGRPRKVNKQVVVDPPAPLPKSRPRPCWKHRPESASPEPNVLSAENIGELTPSGAILAATEGLLGLSKAGKPHAAGASQPEAEDSTASEFVVG